MFRVQFFKKVAIDSNGTVLDGIAAVNVHKLLLINYCFRLHWSCLSWWNYIRNFCSKLAKIVFSKWLMKLDYRFRRKVKLFLLNH